MSLQIITGSSGSGKSHILYKKVIEESIRNEAVQSAPIRYIALVPEQFTMQTQKDIVMRHPRMGVMNIDILSFERLAYKVFEEAGSRSITVLDDTGKSLILRKVIDANKDKLIVYKNKAKMQGFVDEMKSMISEMLQYGVDEDKLSKMDRISDKKPLLKAKLQDISLIYKAFLEYLSGNYITTEGVLDTLCQLVPHSSMLKNSRIYMDCFTGFTPIQYKLMKQLMIYAKDITITVTIPSAETEKESELFHLSNQTIRKLKRLAVEAGISVEQDIHADKAGLMRFNHAPSLAHIEKYIFRHCPNTTHSPLGIGSADDICIYIASNPKSEAELAARTIRRLIREKGYRYRDIAVVTGNMELYYRSIDEIFHINDIPVFMDHKRKFTTNPFVKSITSVIELIEKNFSYESVFRYLKSGMLPFENGDIDEIENYVIALGIRGYRSWNNEWKRLFKGMKEEDLERMNGIRVRVMEPLVTLRDVLKDKNSTVRTFTEGLYEFVSRYEMHGRLLEYKQMFDLSGHLGLSREYAQTYKLVMDLFDKMVSLLGGEMLTIKEYRNILEAGFHEIQVGIIPSSIDSVLVGDIERTRLNHIKALLFLGVNEGIVPKLTTGAAILSDAERMYLKESDVELTPTARDNAFIQMFYLYMNLTKPNEQLFISYSKSSSDGKALRPSYLIRSITQLFEDLEIKNGDEMYGQAFTSKRACFNKMAVYLRNIRDRGWNPEDQPVMGLYGIYHSDTTYRDKLMQLVEAAFYTNPNSKLDVASARAVFGGNNIYAGVTRLEKYAACAYSHFLQYGLTLAERQTYEVEFTDIGNLYHNALELFAKKLESSGYTWASIDTESRKKLISECVSTVAEQYGNTVMLSTARNKYMIHHIERVVERSVWALCEQIKNGHFEPRFFEIDFREAGDLESLNMKLSEEDRLDLHGKVDRVDIYESEDNVFVKIIDYKSGNKKFDIVDTYYGLQLQLVLYMGAVNDMLKKQYSDKQIIPAGVFYYGIKNPYIDKMDGEEPDELDRRFMKQFRMSGLVNRSYGIIEAMDRTLRETGKSDIIPVEYTKYGLGKRSSTLDTEQFDRLIDFVKQKAKEIGKEMIDGNISANPYKKSSLTSCDYCSYKNACGFDTGCGDSYRQLPNVKPEDVLEG